MFPIKKHVLAMKIISSKNIIKIPPQKMRVNSSFCKSQRSSKVSKYPQVSLQVRRRFSMVKTTTAVIELNSELTSKQFWKTEVHVTVYIFSVFTLTWF